MSWPYLEFCCSKCDFNGSDLVGRGLMSYVGPSGLVPIERQLGWCNNCHGPAPMEILPSEEQTQEFQNRDNPSFCENIDSDDQFSKDLLAKDKVENEHLRKLMLATEKMRLTVLDGRKSPPRCLICGSTQVFDLFGLPGERPEWSKSKVPVPVGVQHPECGGDLLVRCSGTFVSLIVEDRFFDLEGLQILQKPQVSPNEISKQLDLWEDD